MISILNRTRVVVALALTVLVLAVAPISAASAQEQQRTYNIPAQPLSSALLEFSRQSDVRVMADPAVVNGRQAPALEGTFTVSEGLDRLLEGSGLAHSLSPSGAILVQQPTIAQPLAAQSNEYVEEEVVVVGTNIRGTAPAGSPLRVYSREEIDRSGRNNIESFFRTIPANVSDVGSTSLGLPSDNASGNSGGGSAINLRGLGTDAALVLLDGERIAPAGFGGSFVDTSFIPLSLLKRVELLTDGASAIYGSDAIAGVVNFVLRDDFDGIEASVRAGAASDYEQYNFILAAGHEWGTGNAALTYSHDKNSNLSSKDRDFSRSSEPFDLAPESSQDTAFATVEQAIGSRADVGATILLSNREIDQISTNSDVSTFTNAKTDQIFGNVRAGAQIGNSWHARANVTYGDSKTHLSNENGTTNAKSDSTSLRLNADGRLATLPTGDLQLALGAEYRQERFDREATGLFDFNAPINRDRNVSAVFGELLIPIVGESSSIEGVRRLLLSLAARYESYSDFGDTTNPKLGVDWTVVKGFQVRGSIGTSFKAPHLSDLYGGTTSILLNAPDPLGPGGVSPALVVFGSNSALDAETSKAWTAGIDWTPEAANQLHLGASYFEIDYEDRIAGPAGAFGDLFGFISQPDLYGPFILRSPSDTVIDSFFSGSSFFNLTEFPGFGPTRTLDDVTVIADERLTNVARTKLSGLDFSATSGLSSGAYDWDFALQGTYLFKKESTLISGLSPIVEVDRLFNPPDLKLVASIFITRGPLTAGVNLNYVDSYTNTASVTPEKVDSWTTADLQFRYQVAGSAERPTFVSVNVTNVFDEAPPDLSTTGLAVAERGYDPVNASPYGRLLSLQLSTRW